MASPYQVGIDLTMTDGVSGVLAAVSRSMFGLEGGVMRLTQGFANLRLGIVGAVAALTGIGLLKGLSHITEHSKELLDQQDKLIRSGVSLNDVLRMTGEYYSRIRKEIPTATGAEYLKQVNELRSVVGQEHAEKIAPWSHKLEAIISNATGKKAEGSGFQMWRALEMTGRTISDPEGSQKLADAFAQNIIGSGGKLTALMYQTMAKRAGVAWANAKPEFLAGPMSVVAAELGGDTAGTALMTAYMFMTGAGTLTKQQYDVMSRAGLINPKKVTVDKGGRINVQPGGIIGSSEFSGKGQFDLFGWSNKYLEPRLAALAMAGGDKKKARHEIEDVIMGAGAERLGQSRMSKEQRAAYDNFMAKVGRNRNTMRMLTMFTDPDFLRQIEKDMTQWGQASSIEKSYQRYITQNPKGVEQAYNAQHEAMMQSIGTPMMQMAIPIMQQMTAFFGAIGEFANSHPTAIKAIGVTIAALGAALTVLGTFAVGGAIVAALGLLGPVAGAIAGISAAVVGLGVAVIAAWPKIKSMFSSLGSWLYEKGASAWGWTKNIGAKAWEAIKGIGASFIDAIAALPGMVATAISKAISSIGSAISGALGRLNPFSKSSAPGEGMSAGGFQKMSNVIDFPRTRIDGAGSSRFGNQQSVVHSNIVVNLDGRQVGRTVVRQIVNHTNYQTSVGSQDTRGTWASPSATTGIAV